MIVMYHDKATEEEWLIVGGKNHYHTKPICDILYIPQSPTKTAVATSSSSCFHHHNIQTVPRLISLAQDRVSSFIFTFMWLSQSCCLMLSFGFSDLSRKFLTEIYDLNLLNLNFKFKILTKEI